MRIRQLSISLVGLMLPWFILAYLALGTAPAAAHHMEGFVYCDANSSGAVDAGDIPLAGVCINVVAADAATTVDNTECTAADGFYKIDLPSIRPANYASTVVSGLPSDAVFILPPVNSHSFLIHDAHLIEVFDWLIDSAICHGCGNGVVEPGETCDPPGVPAGASGNICRADCTVCGDGVVDPGEDCDDGNNIPGDGCEPDCSAPFCGDGIVGNTPGETCDPPGSNAGLPNECRPDCTFCGDGTLDTGESCDDGNNISGDGCEADCTLVCEDRKTDFTISLTPKEKFVWMTSKPYNQRGNQIQAYNGQTGYLFCWAIRDKYAQLEIDYDQLKGDATVISATGSAFNYNAIPSQALAVIPDKRLHLDGVEYSAGPSQIMLEGLAGIPGTIEGTLAVVNPGIDLVRSIQPEFNINVTCWNEMESKFSRHLHFKDFEQYDQIKKLQLELSKIFTLGWHCAANSTHAMWAVLHQNFTPLFQWGENVWQHPASCVPSAVILPGAVVADPALCLNGVLDPGEPCDPTAFGSAPCNADCTYAGAAGQQCSFLNEPGSFLVYPLIDNINGNTIVNIANTGDQDVALECYMVSAPCLP